MAAPLAALPDGTEQLKAGMAWPASEVTLLTEHSGTGLQVLPPNAVTSQTNRLRRFAGGVMFSATRTLVANEGPLLVTLTW
jgi:hypothetical protein